MMLDAVGDFGVHLVRGLITVSDLSNEEIEFVEIIRDVKKRDG